MDESIAQAGAVLTALLVVFAVCKAFTHTTKGPPQIFVWERPLGNPRVRNVVHFRITTSFYERWRGLEEQYDNKTGRYFYRTFYWVYIKGIPEERDTVVK